MSMNLLLNEIQSAAILYAEILLCIAAATILGWFIGLMMRRGRHKKQLAETARSWEDQYRALEDRANSDADDHDHRYQTVLKEIKTLRLTNSALTDTIRKNDTNIQHARSEAIELNRQHTETHERLQRIIQQKDIEIAELGNRLNLVAADAHRASGSMQSAQKPTVDNTSATDAYEGDLNDADTMAVPPALLTSDALDATVQISVPQIANFAPTKTSGKGEPEQDPSLDDTADLSGIGIEESTIALDEEALAFARQSFKRGRGD